MEAPGIVLVTGTSEYPPPLRPDGYSPLVPFTGNTVVEIARTCEARTVAFAGLFVIEAAQDVAV